MMGCIALTSPRPEQIYYGYNTWKLLSKKLDWVGLAFAQLTPQTHTHTHRTIINSHRTQYRILQKSTNKIKKKKKKKQIKVKDDSEFFSGKLFRYMKSRMTNVRKFCFMR